MCTHNYIKKPQVIIFLEVFNYPFGILLYTEFNEGEPLKEPDGYAFEVPTWAKIKELPKGTLNLKVGITLKNWCFVKTALNN